MQTETEYCMKNKHFNQKVVKVNEIEAGLIKRRPLLD